MMPIAMVIGFLFYDVVSSLSFLTPFLIGFMLFLTYCNVNYKEIRLTKFHLILLTVQLLGSSLIYLLLYPINPIIAQGAMICILAPTATAAPVIAGILGGNVESLATYSLFCNLSIALVAPFWFAFCGTVDATSFGDAVFVIAQKVFLLLLLPFLVAFLLNRFFPKTHALIKSYKGFSFYLWSLALIIITGRTVEFVINASISYTLGITLGLVALFICIFQFMLGRYIGRRWGETIVGGQGLGQKNTILAIWMAQTYLNPLASVAPGSYVLWQNLINSYQIWRKEQAK